MNREDLINLVMIAYDNDEVTSSKAAELLGIDFLQEFLGLWREWTWDRDYTAYGTFIDALDYMECTDDISREFSFGFKHAVDMMKAKVAELRDESNPDRLFVEEPDE